MTTEYDEQGNIKSITLDNPPRNPRKYLEPQRKPDPLEFWPNMIMRLSLAIGFSATILAVFFAIIYSFLRWVLA